MFIAQGSGNLPNTLRMFFRLREEIIEVFIVDFRNAEFDYPLKVISKNFELRIAALKAPKDSVF